MVNLSILLIKTPTNLILVTFQLSNKTVAKITLYGFKVIIANKKRNSNFLFQNVKMRFIRQHETHQSSLLN